ncbi:MAG: succinylglutamate desuccinylase [Halomonas sp.]|jgi:succinylglutamate desuccinylase|uniref:Succinylglutamate desuccinylase n=1 Tax=Billgrantia tianxiuensis TaxID=2497861 RepID=A0A6I6SKV9_9GAMM|nr:MULTISPECIES: succinylglutamate desuccinylase [Halomonas]MCE8033627.1 succinylglutamate desuccinylase [Halomonas sp. MCCC 1A11057]MDX5434839.1 succinylglutamate desuccinylase [Halomonas sp.]QHC51219.1 succinylglutamate desuccinylase [Halomonas tianxiuensis]
MLSEWIEHSLEDISPRSRSGRLRGGTYTLHAPGILELTPSECRKTAHACVVSAGIHGNETAPIELLGDCLARIEAGMLPLGAPALIILGNLEAIRRAERYVTTNLNRLFRRDLDETGLEPDRARQLMDAVDAFYARHPGRERLHYDLHTAIRDSRFPRFAVEPFADAATRPEQWRWLAEANIQAVLHQHQHSWTFSHYSKHYHQAQAFTLELGRVNPFGHNDLIPLVPMARLIEALLEGREPRGADPARMVFFRVAHELRRHSADFRLCFPDDTPNFTEFAPGSRLAEDAEAGPFTVEGEPLSVVFPNAEVELGARAALLARPASPPG